MKNQILKILYDALNTTEIDSNPFRSRQFHYDCNRFIDTYINADNQDKACNELERLLDECQMATFEKGFFIAVELMQKS